MSPRDRVVRPRRRPENLGNQSAPPGQRRAVAPQGAVQSSQRGAASGQLAAMTGEEQAPPTTGEMLTTLSTAQGDPARRAAALALATRYREQMVDQAQLRAYLGRRDVLDAEKTATLGQLAAEKARAEYLLGRAHLGGDHSWESPSNRGAFPDHYQNTVQTHGRSSGAEWCTSFAGTMQSELGFQFADSGAEARSPFWSGLRFDNWARTGQTNAGAQITPAEGTLAAGAGGGDHIAGSVFGQLRASLAAAKTDEERRTALNAWVATNGAPQAGDIIVMDGNNSVVGSSHTVLVERYDHATGVLTTVEGNANNRVASRSISLLSAADVVRLASLGRVGASHFAGYQQGSAGGPAPTDPAAAVTANMLLTQARAMVQRLFDVVRAAGWVANGTATDSANTWGGASGTISTQ